MTTLHLTNAYHPTSGGIRTFYNALLEAANRHRRRVVLVVPGEQTETTDVGDFGRIYSVKAPPAPAFDRRYRLLLPHTYLPMVRSAVIEILERERPQLVEICDKYSLPYFAAMLRKRVYRGVPRPALVGLSCERFDDNMAAYMSSGRAALAFTRWYIRHIYGPPFDAHIAISHYVAAELRAALHDRPDGFIRITPLGVDADRFGPACATEESRRRLRELAGASADSTLLLYAGRISPEKNIELLVATMRELIDRGIDCRMLVAGDGPRADWLRTQGEALGHRIRVLGNLSRPDLAACLAGCDVFVHPNPREPFGIGPLEAMASGVPVVVPAAGGVLEYATPRNAWLAPAEAAAFANAVLAARFRDADRLRRAADTARELRWSRVTARFFALYDDIRARVSAMTATSTAGDAIALPERDDAVMSRS